MKTLPIATGLTLLLTLAAASAGAAEAQYGANTVRIGLYAVSFRPNATDITGPYVPPGLNIHIDSVNTLYLAYVRRLSGHFDLELAFGYPPDTDTEGRGPVRLGSVPYDGQIISTAKWFAPTALLNFNFLDDSHALRPYIGVGINYSRFYDRRSTAAGNAASGGPTRIDLTASVGPAATAGLSWRVHDHWSLYASYSLSRVRSVLHAETAGVVRTSRISFGPQALVLSAGYSF